MDWLQIVSFLLVAAAGSGVVATREPLRQSIAASFFGLPLTILFTVLQAPDVALSEMVIGAVAYPLIVVATVAKSGGKGA